jgi:hypothetical protein
MIIEKNGLEVFAVIGSMIIKYSSADNIDVVFNL